MANSILVLDGYKGLGTFFWVELFLLEDEELHNRTLIQSFLEETISSFNDRYSRFRYESLLSELNRNKIVAYDYHLATMLKRALEASQVTNNAFTLFIKEALEEKGYGKQSNIKIDLKQRELSFVTINEETISLHGNIGIDLGGIGKGYLIDLLATSLQEKFDLHFFVINGGGDIYATSNHGSPVTLYLEHPINEGEYIGSIQIKNMAFCSSSSFKRRWQKNGKEVNHFIADKEVWAASYVLADTATIADIYATVYCIESDNEERLMRLSRRTTTEYTVITREGKILQSDHFRKIIRNL